MVDKPQREGAGTGEGAAPRPPRSARSADERSALARDIFAQLREPSQAAGTPPPPPAGQPPVAVPPVSVGGIRVVGPAAQAVQAQAIARSQREAARPTAATAVETKARAQARAAFGAIAAPAAAPVSAAPALPPRPAPSKAAPPRAEAPPSPRARFRFRLLPVTIFLLVLMLGVRVGDSWRVLTRGGSLPDIPPVVAQTAPASGKDAPKDAPPAQDAAKDQKAKEAETANMLLGREPKPDTIDLELVKHLTERREELERRAHDMDQREALIIAGEKRIDQKMAELEGVRQQIQDLLKQVDDKQKAQIESLVRIYENMKPKDAARIFENLDMPVLMEVVERMKEAKTAPVLAAMDPMKAKDLTTALAERRRLPSASQ